MAENCKDAELYMGLTGAALSIALAMADKIRRQCAGEISPGLLVSFKTIQQALNGILGNSSTASAKRRTETFIIATGDDGLMNVRRAGDARTYTVPRNDRIANVAEAVNMIFGAASRETSADYSSFSDPFGGGSSYIDISGDSKNESSFFPTIESTAISNHPGALHASTPISSRKARSNDVARGSTFLVKKNANNTYSVHRAENENRTFNVPANAQVNSPAKAVEYLFGTNRTYNKSQTSGSEGAAGGVSIVRQIPNGTFVEDPQGSSRGK